MTGDEYYSAVVVKTWTRLAQISLIQYERNNLFSRDYKSEISEQKYTICI